MRPAPRDSLLPAYARPVGGWQRRTMLARSPRPSSPRTRVSPAAPRNSGSLSPHLVLPPADPAAPAASAAPATAAQQSLVSYVQTFEQQPGSTALKARFLILAGSLPSLSRSLARPFSLPSALTPPPPPLSESRTAQRDGSCKLHKAKQNPNGSFSIGKTWALEDLQRVHVGKVSCAPTSRLAFHIDSDWPHPKQRMIAGRPHVSSHHRPPPPAGPPGARLAKAVLTRRRSHSQSSSR